MIQWLCNTIFKQYINNLVDQRFQENVYEQIRSKRTHELRDRAAAVRATLDISPHHGTKKPQGTPQPSSNIRRSDTESRVQTKTPENTAVKKTFTSADIKAKLAGIKK
tara:strand:+ start:65 stop:388 length:324 start_codon:yes stop_codon:yes gene_type:complete